MPRPALSLKARALAMLARREHSRAEMRRKLLPHARAAALAAQVEALGQGAGGSAAKAAAPSGAAAEAKTGSVLLSRLHRSPGQASARPGVFSSGAASRRHGVAEADADADAGNAAAIVPDTAAAWAEAEQAVEALLEWLQAQRYLSEERFVESRVNARAARFGNLRIRQELAQHGVALDADAAQQLRESEFERCREVWTRKFGAAPPADAAQRARQMRFLARRGFSADVIRRVLQSAED